MVTGNGSRALFARLMAACAASRGTAVLPAGSYGGFVATARFFGVDVAVVPPASGTEGGFKLQPSAVSDTECTLSAAGWKRRIPRSLEVDPCIQTLCFRTFLFTMNFELQALTSASLLCLLTSPSPPSPPLSPPRLSHGSLTPSSPPSLAPGSSSLPPSSTPREPCTRRQRSRRCCQCVRGGAPRSSWTSASQTSSSKAMMARIKLTSSRFLARGTSRAWPMRWWQQTRLQMYLHQVQQRQWGMIRLSLLPNRMRSHSWGSSHRR